MHSTNRIQYITLQTGMETDCHRRPWNLPVSWLSVRILNFSDLFFETEYISEYGDYTARIIFLISFTFKIQKPTKYHLTNRRELRIQSTLLACFCSASCICCCIWGRCFATLTRLLELIQNWLYPSFLSLGLFLFFFCCFFFRFFSSFAHDD